MEDSTARLPKVTLDVCTKVIEICEKSTDSQASYSGRMYRVSNLIIRVYSQSNSEEFKSKCLDLVDRMKTLGIYNIDNALASFER